MAGDASVAGHCPACLLALAIDVPGEPDDRSQDRLISSCRVINLLGAGPRGATYLAEDATSPNRLVVLKVFGLTVDAAERPAIDRRIAALVRLRHLHIVPVLGGGVSEQGQPFVISPYVPSVTLTRHVNGVAPGVEARRRLIAQVDEAVRHAHDCGLTHGRLVAANVLVSVDAGQPMARVTDFGLDRSVSPRIDLEALEALRAELTQGPS